MSRPDVFIPHTQPEFPEKDLTKENAEMLAIILGNQSAAVNAHVLAEGADITLRVAHPLVVDHVSSHTDGARVAAVSYGNNLFEGAASMVAQYSAPAQTDGDINRIWVSTVSHDLFHGGDNPFVAHSDAVDEFKTDMPNTAGLIEEASRRFFRGLTEYAIFGAALERQIILDAQSIVTK